MIIDFHKIALSGSTKKKVLGQLNFFVHNYMPRRLILLIDLIIALFSAFASFYLVSIITNTPIELYRFKWELWIIVLVQLVFFVLFRSYAGLVRYSSFRDAGKQLTVISICVIALLIFNQVYYIPTHEKLVLNATVIIYGVFAFLLLFLFRIVVKGIYEFISSGEISRSAFILGTGREDVDMASGLIAQNSNNLSIVGFINTDDITLKINIFDLPIFNIDQLSKRRIKAEIIIVSEEKLSQLRDTNMTFLSNLLAMKFKIYKLPKLQDWENPSDSRFKELKEINIEDLLQRSPIKLNNLELFSIYKDKTIVVSGAAGSIGSEIVRQLIAFKPKKILLIDQAETPLHELTLELNHNYPNLSYQQIIADVRNRKRMTQIFREFDPQVVFHAAAYKHVPMMEANAVEAISVNFQGTRNIAELALEYEIERFVFVSTDKAVNPTNIMGATKRAAELFIQSLTRQKEVKTNFITTRFGNVLGSNGSVVPYFKKQIAAGGPVTVTHPEIIRYFMTIDEACQLVLEAGGIGKGGEIFVFDMGSPIKIFDLAKQMIRLSGLIPEEDIKIEFTGLRPGEKLYEELLADQETTIKTHHEKIMVGQATYDFNKSNIDLLNKLLCTIQNYECDKALQLLKQLVPEYHCENSPQTNTTMISE